MKRTEYLQAIKQLVIGNSADSDVLPLGEVEENLAFTFSLKEHSRNRPRKIVEKIDGDGGFDYKLSTNLTSYQEGFTTITQVEYPVDDTDQTADMLEQDEWEIYQKPDAKYLRFKEDKPTSDEDIRVTYTAFHTCTATGNCTVEIYDEEAVQCLAASIFCEMLSTYHAQTGDSTIDADAVNHRTKSQEYASRAKVLRSLYFRHLGIKEGEIGAASVHYEWDKNASWGSQKLTHKPKYR